MILSRFAYTPTDTQGRLIIGDWSCWTIEQPWVRGETPGGKPFSSCIPDGTYKIRRHERPNGDTVLLLTNPDLGVYYQDWDRPEDNQGRRAGRYLCLIHPANTARQVHGCIAPGKRRIHTNDGMFVTDSQATMIEIMQRTREVHTLTIQQTAGAIDTPLEVAA